jgi:alpha-D-xyloside xylohydrolase
MTWNDAGHRLTIGRREGSFPGMAQQRTFVVRLPGRQPKTVSYTGRAVSVKL